MASMANMCNSLETREVADRHRSPNGAVQWSVSTLSATKVVPALQILHSAGRLRPRPAKRPKPQDALDAQMIPNRAGIVPCCSSSRY